MLLTVGLSLWNEMKIFRSVMNVKHGVAQSNPAIMSAAQIISMATKEGYRLMKEEGGVIAEGKKADFITTIPCSLIYILLVIW